MGQFVFRSYTEVAISNSKPSPIKRTRAIVLSITRVYKLLCNFLLAPFITLEQKGIVQKIHTIPFCLISIG